jgi:hypothetical protein
MSLYPIVLLGACIEHLRLQKGAESRRMPVPRVRKETVVTSVASEAHRRLADPLRRCSKRCGVAQIDR